MQIITVITATPTPTHAIHAAVTDAQTGVPTAFWVPETITVNGASVSVTWLGWYSRETHDAGLQPANQGGYPRPTTQISEAPPIKGSLQEWVCGRAIASTASSNPMNVSAPNIFAGGEVVALA